MNTRQLCYHFDRIMTEAGIEIESMSGEGERSRTFRNKGFHSFRHTMTSTLKNAGVPAEWRMMMLDHDSEEVHAGYSHSDVETIAKWVGGVNLSLPG
jgi:integrase